jgi:hypothetical protein
MPRARMTTTAAAGILVFKLMTIGTLIPRSSVFLDPDQ